MLLRRRDPIEAIRSAPRAWPSIGAETRRTNAANRIAISEGRPTEMPFWSGAGGRERRLIAHEPGPTVRRDLVKYLRPPGLRPTDCQPCVVGSDLQRAPITLCASAAEQPTKRSIADRQPSRKNSGVLSTITRPRTLPSNRREAVGIASARPISLAID